MKREISDFCGDGIQCDVSERILTITFDRPQILNAFSYSMLNAFLRALKMGDEHPDVGAIIVTGNGRAFSAGTDISGDPDGFEHKAVMASHEPDFGGLIALQIYRSSKPVIAAVNGAAVGFWKYARPPDGHTLRLRRRVLFIHLHTQRLNAGGLLNVVLASRGRYHPSLGLVFVRQDGLGSRSC